MRSAIVALLLLGLVVTAWGYANAVADPIVRRATLALRGWPPAAPPIRAVLISDLHVAGPDMPPARLARIVTRINSLEPDVILMAGDLISDKAVATRRYEFREALAPLAAAHARLGVVAVLGNHDYWRDGAAARRTLQGLGVTVLDNDVVVRGGLLIAGIDDLWAGTPDVAAVAGALSHRTGPVIALSHSPDIAPDLPARIGVVLAGHTHCGQINLPGFGPLATASKFGRRYACGIIREPGRAVIVGAGLGTSILPMRFGAPPDLWLLSIGPAAR